MAVAARVAGGRRVVIYGAVLPWLAIRAHAPDLVRDGERYIDAFRRVLAAQRADIDALRARGEFVVWAGDFNQSVGGANLGGSNEARAELNTCLDEMGFAAWNGDADHANEGLHTIDLICGPKGEQVLAQGRIDPVLDGVTMSDHAGYWVDLASEN